MTKERSYYEALANCWADELADLWSGGIPPCDDSHEPQRIPGQLRKIDGQGFHCVFFCGICRGQWSFKTKKGYQHWISKNFMVSTLDYLWPDLLKDYSLSESRKQLAAVLSVYQCKKCDADGKVDRTCVYGPCIRTDTQSHHFEPRSIYGDKECEKWSKGFLCPIHHREWHTRVTPYMKTYGAFRLVSPILWEELMTLVPDDQVEAIETQRSVEQDLQQQIKVTTSAIGEAGRFS